MKAFSHSSLGRSAPRRALSAADTAEGLPAEGGDCGFAQTALGESQWNLDRLAGPQDKNPGRISQLDGSFAPPGCLCGRGVDLFILDTGRVHLILPLPATLVISI